MEKFLEKVKKSIYGPEYYQAIIGRPFSYSLKYYFTFILALGIIFSAVFSIRAVPEFRSAINLAKENVLEKYPAELEVKIQKGKVSTNVAEPYIIPAPAELKEEGKVRANVLVIDTASPATEENLAKFDTLILLTEKSIAFSEGEGKTTIQSLQAIDDLTVNKQKVESFAAKIEPFIKAIALFIPLIFFIGFFAASVFRLAYLLLGALLVWLAAAIHKVPIGYGKAYQLGLHLMTLPMVFFTAKWLFPGSFNMPLLFSLMLFVMAILNLKLKPEEAAPPNVPTAAENTGGEEIK